MLSNKPDGPCTSMRNRDRILSGAAFAVLAWAGGAQAQQAQDPEVSQVDEIIVTAQRRSQRLEDIPMAVTALTTEALENADVVNLHEIGRIAPGVQMNFGGLSSQPSIRGVSSLTNGTGNENNVAVYVDGFYVPDTTSINSDLANLESIQVLKGPQGTLYGRNATGGAILINTLAPSDTFTGKIEGTLGRFDERRLSGYISGPISEQVRFSAAGAVRESDGHIRLTDPTDVTRTDGDAAPVEQRSLRTKLEVDLSENLQATLGYNYAFASDATGVLFTPLNYIPAFLPGGNLRANRLGTASYNYGSEVSTETSEGTLKLRLTTPIGVFTSYTSQARRAHELDYDFDGTYADLTYSEAPARQKTFQQAVDLVVNAGDRLDLVVGALYFKDRIRQVAGVGQVTYGPGLVPQARVYRPLETEAYAVYADATYQLTDRLSIGAGARYSYDKKGVAQYNTDGVGNITLAPFEREADFDSVTPRASIRYELAPRSNVYAAYSRGYRSGSFNSAVAPSAALTLPIEPEEISAYEIGYKTVQPGFRFETAAFYYDYTNLNVSLTIPNPLCAGQPVCSPVTVVGNAPEATIYGLDGQITLSPIENLNLSLGASWLHARYGDFPNAIGTGINATGTLNVSGQTQDWSGKQMSRAPNFSGNVSVDYSLGLAGGQLKLAANLSYSTGYAISNPSLFGPLAPAALQGQQRFRQGETTLVNADITWTDPSDRYWIGVYGKNLTDERYRQTYNGANFGDYSAMAQPTTYGVRLGARF